MNPDDLGAILFKISFAPTHFHWGTKEEYETLGEVIMRHKGLEKLANTKTIPAVIYRNIKNEIFVRTWAEFENTMGQIGG